MFILLGCVTVLLSVTEEDGSEVGVGSLISDKRLWRLLEINMMESGTEILLT